ncbi:MAG: 4-hydroxy-tetrahydrodipicolinate reductase [Alphaproteobacteria bacterium]|nr:4-hydroxy-tetrahydrodipicolinate reductase [Alphaproteobacteria bacterium]
MKKIKIGIAGITGRMGRLIFAELVKNRSFKLISGSEKKSNAYIGKDIGNVLGTKKIGIHISDDPEVLFSNVDVVVDFTSPKAVMHHVKLAQSCKVCHVIGVTGLTATQERKLKLASKKTAILYASNMSLGINLLISFVESLSQRLKEEFHVNISDIHHRHKVDAPSGTAISFGLAAARGKKIKLPLSKIPHLLKSSGKTSKFPIDFTSIRKGNVAGKHSVTFSSKSETITLGHEALDRAIFARGAIFAAEWIAKKSSGFYSMEDVFSL